MLHRDQSHAARPAVVGSPWRTLRLVIVTALVAVIAGLAIVAGAQLLQRWNNVVPPPLSTASPSPAASMPVPPSEPAPTVLSTPSLAWNVQRLEVSTFDGSAFPAALAYARGRFVAVGGRDCDWPDPPACWGGVWTSSDGASWAKLERSPALEVGTFTWESGPGQGLLDVAAGPGGFVAIGYGVGGAAAWYSLDGLVWSLAPADGAFDAARIHGVASTPAGWAIVGVVHEGADNLQTGRPRAAIWTSPDGARWQRVPDGPAFDIGGYWDTLEEPGTGGIEDIAGNAGAVVAVGESCDDHGRACVQATWRSTDGLTWERMPDGKAGALTSVAGSAAGFVAGGAECDGFPEYCDPSSAPILKQSATGLVWATVQGLELGGAVGPIAADHGFFAVVWSPQALSWSEQWSGLRVLASVDGVEWMLLPAWQPELSSVRGVSLAGDGTGRVVVLGWTQTGSGGYLPFGAVITSVR